jgi:tetratricopeptide (TPR) repeat protein
MAQRVTPRPPESRTEQPPPLANVRRVALAIFVTALLVRLLHIWQLRSSPFFDVLMGDARAYDDWAQRLAGGDWLGSEVFYQAPLYPYFLGAIYAVFGRDLAIVRVCQAIVGSAACMLVALTAWRLFSKQAAIVAGVGLAVYAPAVFFDGLIQKSVLDVFFLSLSIWLLSGIVAGPLPAGGSVTPFVVLGLAMGALSLTRENALVLVAVIAAWIVLRVRREADTTSGPAVSGLSGTLWIRALAAFALGLMLVLGPVAARNYAVGGGFYITTSQFGPNFYIGNNPQSDGTYSSLRPGRGAPEYERQDATELAEGAVGRSLTPAEVSSYWTDRALAFITAEPGAWLRLLARKAMLLVNADEMLDTESQASHAEWSSPLKATGWFSHFGVLVPLALIGVWATWADRRRLLVFYALTIAYAASVLLFYVFARYRFPLVPLLMLFAASGVTALSELSGFVSALRQLFFTGAGAPSLARPYGDASPRISAGSSARHGRRRWRLGVAVPIAIAVAVLANWPVLSTSRMRAITETNLGTALYETQRFDEAIVHYERAIALTADYAPAYSNMGAALRSKGRLQEAVAAHRRALQIQPDNPDTHFNLANALLDLNRPQEAAEHFRLAGRAAPPGANVENNLGIALAAEGKMAEAAAAFRRAVALEPESARAHRNLGDALTSLGRVDEGIVHFRRAIELDPANASFRYDLAVALLEAGRAPQAIDEFRAALNIDPTLAPAHNNLGVALGSQGRLNEAIDHFRQALKIQPEYADAQRNLEMALRARDEVKREGR